MSGGQGAIESLTSQKQMFLAIVIEPGLGEADRPISTMVNSRNH